MRQSTNSTFSLRRFLALVSTNRIRRQRHNTSLRLEQRIRPVIDLSTPNVCKGCGCLIAQAAGGHRKREYCTDACKMRDRRKRQEQKAHEQTIQLFCARWGDFLPQTVQVLEAVIQQAGAELAEKVAEAVTGEISARDRDYHTEMTALRQQVQALQRKLTTIQNVEE